MKRVIVMLTLAALLVAALSVSAAGAFAAPLPDNCDRTQGTVTCTTEGKNPKFTQETETQGNTSNTSPAPQDLQSGCSESNPGNSCPGGQF